MLIALRFQNRCIVIQRMSYKVKLSVRESIQEQLQQLIQEALPEQCRGNALRTYVQ